MTNHFKFSVAGVGVLGFLCLAACQSSAAPASRPASQPTKAVKPPPPTARPANHKVALFAGGCFWCMEKPFDVLDGVYSTTSGYTDGHVDNPTYKAVSRGTTGHTEAIEIVYDPTKITYAKLLHVFWRNIDPTAKNRQFCDSGTQYRSGIYYKNDAEKELALKSKSDIETSGAISGTIYTDIKAATVFYPAEEYHQNFYKKKPGHYKRYRYGCGRDRRLQQLWGDSK
jgi:peptide-methionine (S)-S-oxide reductase